MSTLCILLIIPLQLLANGSVSFVMSIYSKNYFKTISYLANIDVVSKKIYEVILSNIWF